MRLFSKIYSIPQYKKIANSQPPSKKGMLKGVQVKVLKANNQLLVVELGIAARVLGFFSKKALLWFLKRPIAKKPSDFHLKNKKINLKFSKRTVSSLFSKRTPSVDRPVKKERQKKSDSQISNEASLKKEEGEQSSSKAESSNPFSAKSSPSIKNKIKKRQPPKKQAPKPKTSPSNEAGMAKSSKKKGEVSLESLIKEAKFDGEAYLIDFSKITPENFDTIIHPNTPRYPGAEGNISGAKDVGDIRVHKYPLSLNSYSLSMQYKKEECSIGQHFVITSDNKFGVHKSMSSDLGYFYDNFQQVLNHYHKGNYYQGEFWTKPFFFTFIAADGVTKLRVKKFD